MYPQRYTILRRKTKLKKNFRKENIYFLFYHKIMRKCHKYKMSIVLGEDYTVQSYIQFHAITTFFIADADNCIRY